MKEIISGGRPGIEYIPEQHEAAAVLAESRAAEERRCFINMATGTGKTDVQAFDIKSFLDENPGARVLSLSHNEFIADHNRKIYEAWMPERSHGSMVGDRREDQADITYALFQTMNTGYEGGLLYQAFDPDEYDYIDVDENHHGPAPTYARVIDYFSGARYVRGRTATPRRSDGQDLSPLFGREAYTFLLEDAIARGRLARPEYHLLTDHVRRLGEIRTELGRLSLGQLNREIFVRRRDGEIADMIAEHLYDFPNPRTIVFCNTVDYAEHMVDFLPGRVKALHARLHPDVQRQRLRDFQNGKLDMLTTVRKLGEGVDIPEANVGVLLRNTESESVFLQDIGRLLRRTAGKDRALILDFAGSWQRIRYVQGLAGRTEESYQRTQHWPTHRRHHAKPKAVEAPFQFDFSEEVLSAIEVLEYARKIRRERSRPIQQQTPMQRQTAAVEALLHAKLPSQSLPAWQAERLAQRIKQGDRQAIDEFMMRQLYLAYAVAEKDADGDPELVQDYFQDIYVSLLEKLQDFGSSEADMHTNVKLLASDARHKHSASSEESSHHLASGQERKWQKIDRLAQRMHAAIGRPPSDAELAEAGGISEESLRLLQRARNFYVSPLPLEAVHLSTIASRYDGEALLEQIINRDTARKFLAELPDRERLVTKMLYGFGDEGERKGVEIARTIDVSAERVFQLRERAVHRLTDKYGYEKPPQAIKESVVICPDGPTQALARELGYVVLGSRSAEAFYNRRVLNDLMLDDPAYKAEVKRLIDLLTAYGLVDEKDIQQAVERGVNPLRHALAWQSLWQIRNNI